MACLSVSALRIGSAGLLDGGELVGLGVGEVVGPLHQRPAGVLEPAGVIGAGPLPKFVPLGPADKVQGSVGVEHHVEGVDADCRVDVVVLADGLRSAAPMSMGCWVRSGWRWRRGLEDRGLLVIDNQHGDTVGLFSPDGTVTDSVMFDPWDDPGVTATGLSLPEVGFQSDWTDPVSGQVWMAARHYTPALGQFTARDTWSGDPGRARTANRFAYTAGGPLSSTKAERSSQVPSILHNASSLANRLLVRAHLRAQERLARYVAATEPGRPSSDCRRTTRCRRGGVSPTNHR